MPHGNNQMANRGDLMRLRYWTALTAIACVVLVATMIHVRKGSTAARDNTDTHSRSDVSVISPDQASSLGPEQDAQTVASDVSNWSRSVEPGDSLDGLLAEAGIDAVTRAEITNAIASEYDLRRLQPGHKLALKMASDGLPENATLEVDDGVQIRAVFGASPVVQVIAPALETVRRAGEATIDSSIYAALDKAGIPTRFATDLQLVLAETLDLRSSLESGERLRLMWRENRLNTRVIGEPVIDFAELRLGDKEYEILWPDDTSRRTMIYENGQLKSVFDQPIMGARLSSAFGPRKHPIHGVVRMHNGVDFAAKEGSPVLATQSGRIGFMGRKSGYGLMVEIDHGNDLRTLYAHLSALNETISPGQRVLAGDEIGSVGSTGTSTAPHLHYEIVFEDRPVSPLTDTRLYEPSSEGTPMPDASGQIAVARHELARLLGTQR
ncbi:MAG: M23 family metallopeptidase [Loktanella sp.]|nr:M23 family metallopeptidase [Loktanella sp.]